ncbi:hypothetical protein AN478_01645 [Thiohalorhabdus denitrificans]|uniref:DUF4350 domain-containing protein n=1 Tax=Thiohalorhabdus denitrificans TaxID=381306 RepID=A0A0P9C8K9_9GAMM|nr:DUF4350 domain-containing protein [Thiohalorhabdus denitrificans]KPV41318.1 hypothetical protein AN478_01645 [Thiohalorhabdus denitrificans]SCY22931.1 protein of unknown function [Thiohalorhabdus denitrificans]
MTRGERLALGGLTLAVLGLVVGGFLLFFKPVEEEVRTDVSLEARKNPFLAAARFLEAGGVPTERARGRGTLEELPPPDRVLFLTAPLADLEASEREELAAWLRAGGHLVTEAFFLWDPEEQASGDPFLDGFGIRLHRHGDAGSVCREEADGEIEVTLPGVRPAMEAEPSPRYYLEDAAGAADGRVTTLCGPHLLTRAVGEGRLTVVSDTGFWRNDRIGEGDHALFLWRVITLTEPAGARFLAHVDMPGLPLLLWEKAPEAILSGAILLLFALWAAYNRFGPPLPPPGSGPRRSLVEHLDALGAFHYRHSQPDRLLEPLRRRLHNRLEGRIALWRHWDRSRRLAWLAEHSGLEEEPLERALYHTPGSDGELLETIQTLQTLGRHL